MNRDRTTKQQAGIAELEERLREAQETLDAIRSGEVDAVVVKGSQGEQVYTLRGAEEPYRVMVEAMTEGAVTFSPDGTILYCNAHFAEMVRAGLEKVIGSPLQRYINPADVEKFSALLEQARATGARENLSMMASDGTVVPVTVAAHHLSEPGMESIVAVITDLTEIMAAEERLRELSVRDALTGLFNRRYLDETLERELARAEREHLPVSVVMMDIDLFKEINDAFGHKAGDILLQVLGERLCIQARKGDVPCRYGGEEFVMVLPDMPPEAATKRAEEWRALVERLRVPYGDVQLHVTLSAGVAAYPVNGKTADAILMAADEALYVAKMGGRNRVAPASRREAHGDPAPKREGWNKV